MDGTVNTWKFLAADRSYEDSRVVVVGCPLDATSTFRSGSRFGPQALRQVSWNLETYSPMFDRDLDEIPICDLGDVELPPGNVEVALSLISRCIGTISADGKFPVAVGGEHLISLATVRELARHHPNLMVVQVDAHTDLRNEYLGEALSHATVMRRIVDVVGENALCQVAIRSGTREEFQHAARIGSLCDPDQVRDKIDGRPVYLTVDLDVLDPAVAPGVSTPEPGGLAYHELASLLARFEGLPLVGCDLVELCPPFDISQQSAIAASKLVRDLILEFC
jgi:agmatinase